MLKYYKPNKAIKGHALSVSFNSKDQSVFLEMIKQTGWSGSNGTFKDGAKVRTKLSTMEVAGFLEMIDKNVPFTGFHKSESQTLQIAFEAYPKPTPETPTVEQKGFSLRLYQTQNDKTGLNFLIGLTFNEGRLLKEYLQFALEHIFTADYSVDKATAKEREEAKTKTVVSTKPPEKMEKFVQTDKEEEPLW